MCGRFTLTSPASALVSIFGVDLLQLEAEAVPPGGRALFPRFNAAPSQRILAVRARGETDASRAGEAAHVAVALRWGLVPSWAKEPSIGNRLINARAETAAEKPAFRSAFRARRCVIAADGFFEWQPPPGGAKGRKQPWWIGLRSGEPFAIAGLWEAWQTPDGGRLETCTLLTTTPNEVLAPIHDRMPVILGRDEIDLWLDSRVRERERLQPMLDPYPAERMTARPVGLAVNDPRRDDPGCLDPPPEG